jgi:PEP-CTERM motif
MLQQLGSVVLALTLLVAPRAAPGSVILEDYATRTFGTHGRDPKPTSGLYDKVDDYEHLKTHGTVQLRPGKAQEVKRGGTDFFLAKLKEQFPVANGWSFVDAGKDLSPGSLVIRTYDADGPQDEDNHTVCTREPPCVGAVFHVEYQPVDGDPRSVHWIQVIKNNHKVPGPHGIEDYAVDIWYGGETPPPGDLPAGFDLKSPQTNPYYDWIFSADNTNFLDPPARSDVLNSHDWLAEVYLVEGPLAPGEVKIYNGIQWGWFNRTVVVPEPPTMVLSGLGLLALLWFRGRSTNA